MLAVCRLVLFEKGTEALHILCPTLPSYCDIPFVVAVTVRRGNNGVFCACFGAAVRARWKCRLHLRYNGQQLAGPSYPPGHVFRRALARN